jgi:cysteine-rich repeat protein
LEIGVDSIFLLAGNLTMGDSAVVDTDEAFHTYRIEIAGDDSVEVYYDDVLTLTGQAFADVREAGRLSWGNSSVLSQGVSEWLSFSHDGLTPLCGDGIVDPPETCDDGNTSPGDGCDALCQIEGGGGVCGDGTVDAGEQCDDGNTVAGDGCSELCQDEEGGFVCAPAPVDGCIPAAKASLAIKETKPGNEKLKAKLKGFQAATGQSDLGNPVTGSTRYDLCIYGPAGQLAGELSIERATQSCGPKQKPCFKDKGGKGWLYKDPSADADGAKKLTLGSGPEGKGKALWQAANKAKKNQTAMPTGIAAALAGASSATVQLVVSGAECFDATLGNIKKAEALLFKAKAP